MTGMQEADFHGLRPIDGMEAHFYILSNGGDFGRNHLEDARSVLGAVVLDGYGLVDARLVVGDATNPTHRGEILLDHLLTPNDLEKLKRLKINAEDDVLGTEAA